MVSAVMGTAARVPVTVVVDMLSMLLFAAARPRQHQPGETAFICGRGRRAKTRAKKGGDNFFGLKTAPGQLLIEIKQCGIDN